MEEEDIIIVGGGICGLATALALHRKGIKSKVLEKSERLRAYGATLTLRTNAWIALHHLGLASSLRSTSLPLDLLVQRSLDTGNQTVSQLSKGEVRCIKRSDLLVALADELPDGTIQFGIKVVSITSTSSCSILHLRNGNKIRAKMVIGCDGVNSMIRNYIGMKEGKVSGESGARGFTKYEEEGGHGLPNHFHILSYKSIKIGRVPLNPHLLYWFITRPFSPQDSEIAKSKELIKSNSMEASNSFPSEVNEMIMNCDINSLSLERYKYHAPWDILVGNLKKGTVTVAGDAFHAMSPYIGQGAAAGLEDAIVLARCLHRQFQGKDDNKMEHEIGIGIDNYLKERRIRVFKLLFQSYLITQLAEGCCFIKKFIIIVCLIVVFRDGIGHTQYDCGSL